MKNIILKTFSLLFLATLFPSFAFAAVLENNYDLNSVHTELVSGTVGLVNITGQVTALPGFTPGSGTPLEFKHKKRGTSTWLGDVVFQPNPAGNFSYTNDDLECNAIYDFRLYDNTSVSLIRVNLPDDVYNEAGIFINCNDTSTGNVYVPASADAEVFQGVNWGNVTATDVSININNATLIPFFHNGTKYFKMEWGYGVPGQPDYTASFYSPNPPYSENPNYIFGRSIGSLVPATDYFFNIREVADPDSPDVTTNLLAYGFKTTGPVASTNTYWDATDTTLHVSGWLVDSNDIPVAERSILIKLTSADLDIDPNLNAGSYAAITTALVPGGSIDTAGVFEHTFTGLMPGAPYFLSVEDFFTGNPLINPIEVTMAEEPDTSTGGTGTDPGGGPGAGGVEEPVYSGLVPCGDNIDVIGDQCDFNDFITLINRVINFLIFFIGFPFVAIVVAYAGIKLLVSGGDTEAKSSAKKMISKVLLGLIMALLCWGIIKLVLRTLGYCGPIFTVFGIVPPTGCVL